MKIKLLTTCHNDGMPGYRRLKKSLDKFGWDYECIVHPFSFGHQLPIIRDWCNSSKAEGYTHIVYVDAFDNIAFAGHDEVISKLAHMGYPKMLISTEKACYPHPERASEYPESNTPWKYVNGGGWLVEIEYFKQLCLKENLNESSHDQVWLMESFLRNQDNIKLDINCEIFQTIAFSLPEEWEMVLDLKGDYMRFRNIGTGTSPIFFHGNGHTEMDWLQR